MLGAIPADDGDSPAWRNCSAVSGALPAAAGADTVTWQQRLGLPPPPQQHPQQQQQQQEGAPAMQQHPAPWQAPPQQQGVHVRSYRRSWPSPPSHGCQTPLGAFPSGDLQRPPSQQLTAAAEAPHWGAAPGAASAEHPPNFSFACWGSAAGAAAYGPASGPDARDPPPPQQALLLHQQPSSILAMAPPLEQQQLQARMDAVFAQCLPQHPQPAYQQQQRPQQHHHQQYSAAYGV